MDPDSSGRGKGAPSWEAVVESDGPKFVIDTSADKVKAFHPPSKSLKSLWQQGAAMFPAWCQGVASVSDVCSAARA